MSRRPGSVSDAGFVATRILLAWVDDDLVHEGVTSTSHEPDGIIIVTKKEGGRIGDGGWGPKNSAALRGR